MILLAIDPGISTGWALFSQGILHRVGTGQLWDCGYPNMCIMEKPQIYPHAKGRPNDLITLAIQVGEYKQLVESRGARVELVLPHTWKGNVPKEIHHARILGKLSEAEKALVPRVKTSQKNPHGYDNNILDAVALGMYRLGRLVPGR